MVSLNDGERRGVSISRAVNYIFLHCPDLGVLSRRQRNDQRGFDQLHADNRRRNPADDKTDVPSTQHGMDSRTRHRHPRKKREENAQFAKPNPGPIFFPLDRLRRRSFRLRRTTNAIVAAVRRERAAISIFRLRSRSRLVLDLRFRSRHATSSPKVPAAGLFGLL